MEEMLTNPFWHALKTEQAALALSTGAAVRYPGDVIPFAALQDSTAEALKDLASLLAPGEVVYVAGESLPDMRGLFHMKQLPCLQMHFEGVRDASQPPAIGVPIKQLGVSEAAAMVALTDAAFPGFFRSHTYVLGSYFGVHVEGQLVAMAGERIALPGYREISAVCTHPGHTGKGYAGMLIQHLVRLHASAGLRSFLHVTATNHRAIALYKRLGFNKTRSVLIHQLRRTD